MINNHKLRFQNPSLAPKKYPVKLVIKKGEIRDAILSIGMKPGFKRSIVSIFDVTELKQAEAEITFKNEQLLKKDAEKDKFFSIIAHDLRGPFGSFLGLTKIMAEELPNFPITEMQEIAVSMRNSATNLLGLLENLLYWTGMHQGLIPFNPRVALLLPIIVESIVVTQEPVRNKGIEITFDIPEGLEVFADNNILQTVIRNLVTNAVKFTHIGGKINLSGRTTRDKSVEISIRDTGIGMNRALIENLFKIDVKTNRKGTTGEPSSGLGMLICKEFVEKHGGKIWVESEEGKGSDIIFTLPAKHL
jgi:signal transduction histidine kinase